MMENHIYIYISEKYAIKQLEKMIREDATITDIGVESTKLNAKYG